MSLRALALAALVCGWLAACAGIEPSPAVASPSPAEPEVLVMLRAAPPHFRPGFDYAGSYDSRAGREARRRIARSLAAQYGLSIVDDWPMPALGVDCFVMRAPSGTAVAPIVDAIARDDRVESAQAMNTFHALGHDDPLFALQPAATRWHLDDIHRVATGRRVRVAEIDTGVEATHPDLAGQVAVLRDFVDAGPPPAEGHGTAVAGIIAARADNHAGIVGIAPNAQLYALRACRQQAPDGAALCTSFTLAKALQFAIDAHVDVVNMSLGGPRDRLLERLIDAAMLRGATVVAAVDPSAADGGFPASLRGVLAIAAEDAHDLPADALRAPGNDVPTTLAGGRWGFVSGSSYAAAHVSGLVAVMRELAPNLSPSDLRDALAPRAVPASAPSRTAIDACGAVARAAGACVCECGRGAGASLY